jgi:hypothetical protein
VCRTRASFSYAYGPTFVTDLPTPPVAESMTRFTCCAGLLLLLCMAPVWLAPAVSMQDYPQHLFITAVLRGDAHPEWTSYYARQLTLAPYTGFYWAAYALTPLFGLDGAGRVFVTAYWLLIGLWVLRLAAGARTPPWAALLAFPFAVSQVYFHGFLNYLFALPLLMLALHELRLSASQRFGAGRLALHGALLLGIVWFHPLCLYVYALLASVELVLTRDSATPWHLRTLPGLLALGGLALWQLESYRDANKDLWWAPFDDSLRYLSLLLTGMRAQPLAAALPGLCLLTLAGVLARSQAQRALDRRDLLQVLALGITYFILPFRIGSYTYVSWRLAPLLGLMLPALFARAPLSRRASWIVVAAAALLSADAAFLQLQVGHESAEIRALVPKVKAGARVTAINFAADSRYLNAHYFSLMHEHDIFYYSVEAGGVSPFLWSDPLIPVRKLPALTLTPPRSLQEMLSQGYGVVFSRQANPAFAHTLDRAYVLRGQSGDWSVFERRDQTAH